MGKFILSFVIASTISIFAIAGETPEEGTVHTKEFVRDEKGNIIKEVTRTSQSTPGESLCSEPEQKAVSTCTIGLDPMQEAQLRGAINQATEMMKSGGTEKTCKAAKLVQTLAMGANFTHAAMCEAAIRSCKKTCTTMYNQLNSNPETRTEARRVKGSINRCAELEARAIASMGAGIQNLMGMAMSQKCQKAVTTNLPPGGAPPPPLDCNDPMMASMTSCICSKNPSDPACSGSNLGLGDGGAGFSSGGVGAVDGGMNDLEMIPFDDEIAALQPSSQGGAGQGTGSSGGGGGMNAGGGAGALPPEESGGAGEGPYNTDIMGGLTGGGGGGSGSYGGGGSGDGSGGGRSMLDTLADKLNLKAFLPSKADFKNRGLASGSGADGITGPNGPSLFEKVSARYHKKQSELLP